MWVAIVIAVIALLMVAFMPKPGVENARASKLGDFQVPRSKYGDPMPLIWGTVRQKSPITLWFGDFNPVPVKKKVPSGLFSSRKVVTGYKNYVGIDCALALGPNVVLRKFWAGTKLAWTGNATGVQDIQINLPDLFGGDEQGGGLAGTMTFYNGQTSPPRDAYLATVLSPDVPAYNGVSRVVFKAFYIGTTTNLEMFSFEVSRITKGLHPTYSAMPNGFDVNPLEICYDVITSRRGSFGNLPSVLNTASFVACAKVLYDEGLGMSLSAQSAVTGKDILEEIMRHCDGLLYQDPGSSEIVAKLIRNDYDPTKLLVLDESNVTDLKNFSKTTWDSTLNQCRVTFKDRASDYDDSVAISQDFANINYQNRVKSTEISSPGCMDATVATKLASRQLSLLSVPLYKCDIVCNRTAQDLRPGDVFKLNWSPFGLKGMLMRVLKIDFGELTDGRIKITCVQDRFATATPVFATPDISGWTPPSTVPKQITDFLIWNAPAYLSFYENEDNPLALNNVGRPYVFAKSPSGTSITFNAIMAKNATSVNNAPKYLTDSPYSTTGVLVNAYSKDIATADRIDATKVFKISGLSTAALEDVPNYSNISDIRDGSAMMDVNGELFAYVGYDINADGSITIKTLYRGILDTEPKNHAAGSVVRFIAGRTGLAPFNMNVISQETAFIKLQDNSTTTSMPLDQVTTRTFTASGRAGLPSPPQYLQMNGQRFPSTVMNTQEVVLDWRCRNRLEFNVYNDAPSDQEPGQKFIIRWKIGNSGFSEITTGSQFYTMSSEIAGKVGRLEIYVHSMDSTTGRRSTIGEYITVMVENPPKGS